MFSFVGDICSLLDKSERREALFVLIFVLFTGLVETLGIVSIAPFLAVLANPDFIAENQYIKMISQYTGVVEQQEMLFLLGVFVLFVLIISNITSAYMNWRLSIFSNMRAHTLSCRMLHLYLYQPYLFFLEKTSSDIAKNILSEVSQVVKNIIVTGMLVVSKIIISCTILFMLLWVDPLLALSVMGAMGVCYAAIYLLVHNRLKSIGETRMKTTAERYELLSQIFTGIKEIKLSSLEDVYQRRYNIPSYQTAKSYAHYDMMGTIPRYLMETVAFGGVLIIVLYLIADKGGVGDALPVIGLYAFSGQRLLPSLQSIFLNVSKIRYGLPSLRMLLGELKIEKTKLFSSNEQVDFNKSIKLENVSFVFPKSEILVLDNINLSIDKGDIIAFVGGTGAGKSTLINIISGLISPSEGSVVVDGYPLKPEIWKAWIAKVGYVSQNIILFNDSIVNNIALGQTKDTIDMNRIVEICKICQIHDFIEKDLPQGYDTWVGENGIRLSGGQRQRIGIARALYKNPEILILDEATSALDNITEQKIVSKLSGFTKDMTVVMVAHRLSTVKDCRRIHLMDHGKIIAQGSYDVLLKTSGEFRALVNPHEDYAEEQI